MTMVSLSARNVTKRYGGVVALSENGARALLIYLLAYLFMNLGAFLVVTLVHQHDETFDLRDYPGLYRRAPLLTLAMAVFVLSLVGIPPLIGFMGKLYLFAALLNHGWVWLAIVGALNSVIALYYYVRIIRNMFLRVETGKGAPLTAGRLQVATVLVMLIPTLLLGVYFTPLVELAQASVKMFGTP